MKWPIIALLLMGVVAAFFAVLLATMLLDSSDEQQQPREVSVLVARENIPAMTIISQEMLEEKTIPAGAVLKGAVEDASAVINRMLAVDLGAGQQIQMNHFVEEGTGKGMSGRLKPGTRAMTVPLSDWEGMEGLLYPGSLVDVVATFTVSRGDERAVSTTHLQGLRVLGVDQDVLGEGESEEVGTKKKSSSRKRLVTLEVTPDQAQDLQLASLHGSIVLTMRNPGDFSIADTEATVLDSGQLLKGARVMQGKPDVGGNVEPTSGEPPPITMFPPSRSKESWEVTILRGSKQTTEEFEKP